MDARLALSDPNAFCYQQLLVASAFGTPLLSLLRLQDENKIWRKRHHLEKGIEIENVFLHLIRLLIRETKSISDLSRIAMGNPIVAYMIS